MNTTELITAIEVTEKRSERIDQAYWTAISVLDELYGEYADGNQIERQTERIDRLAELSTRSWQRRNRLIGRQVSAFRAHWAHRTHQRNARYIEHVADERRFELGG